MIQQVLQRQQAVLGSRSKLLRSTRFLSQSQRQYKTLQPFHSLSTAVMKSSLVSSAWLKDRLGDKTVKVLDASWYMPNGGRDPVAEYKAGRIPGARFFDIEAVSAPHSDLPHMLPSDQAFAAAADALDISNDDFVVVYDGAGIFSAPRAWWTFKVFGHSQVVVLDGGMPQWKADGGMLETSTVGDDMVHAAARACREAKGTARYQARFQAAHVRSIEQMLKNLSSQEEVVVDARGPGRFHGTAPEPRAGVRGGHIPGSHNVPFDAVLSGNKYKPKAELATVFKNAGVDLGQPVVTSCGTGVTASVLALAIHEVDPSAQVAVYDGSWTEWGSRQDTPVEASS